MAYAFRGWASSESDDDERGGFVRTFADRQEAKRRKTEARLEAAKAGRPWDADADASEGDFLDTIELPSDAEVALQSLRPKTRPRLVLVHHVVPGILDRRGVVEKDLRSLAAAKKIKYLQLPTASGDVAVLDAAEYAEALSEAPALAAFALGRAAALYATTEDLEAAGFDRDAVDGFRRRHFLRPRRDSAVDAHWFAVPDAGRFANDVLDGRRKLQLALKRSKYSEVNVDRAVAALAGAPLGQEFHVRDLVGRGDAQLQVRPAGRFLKALRKFS